LSSPRRLDRRPLRPGRYRRPESAEGPGG
jgi:hypothetical protein